MGQQPFHALMYVEMELYLEVKSVMMKMMNNTMDATIVNINVKLNAQDVFKVNAMNVTLMAGKLIQISLALRIVAIVL